ncbi:MAG: hypothetical protein QOF17_270 [Solirubrobacteraceae bacterium]|jgi:hypothetical protein|nr:hypothetical protein [Solirubrobacteraceae bacterium]
MPLAVAALALVVALAPAAAASWVPPVPGAVARAFHVRGDPFAAGLHRGADFAVPAGAPVRAACGGRVAVAGRIGSSGGVVTIACGRWRVSHLPLSRIVVRRGDAVRAGDAIGLAGRSRLHAGLHLGVRAARARAGSGYVDPLRFLTAAHRPPPPAAPVGPRRPRRMASAHAPPAPAPAPPALAGTPASRALAPWPAWAGLALLLAGAAGGGLHLRLRSRYGEAPPMPRPVEIE